MNLKIPTDARSIHHFAGGEWTLYELPFRDGDSFLWLKFKLIHNVPRAYGTGARRAYRLSWNAAEERFARDGKTAILKQAHPDLFAQVELHMSLNHGADSLLADPEEIAAERARLAAAKKEWKAARRRA